MVGLFPLVYREWFTSSVIASWKEAKLGKQKIDV
jgi:hypothetical protein